MYSGGCGDQRLLGFIGGNARSTTCIARFVGLDFGFALVHLFHPEERAYYNIERLWEGDDNMIRYPISE